MSIKGLILRFSIVYMLAIFLGGAIAQLLELKGISNVGILFAVALYACSAFGAGNQRRFRRIEKWQAVSGMLFVDLVIQIGAGWSFAIGKNGPTPPFITPAIVQGSLFIVFVHGVVILAALGFSERIMGRHLTEIAPSGSSTGGSP